MTIDYEPSGGNTYIALLEEENEALRAHVKYLTHGLTDIKLLHAQTALTLANLITSE